MKSIFYPGVGFPGRLERYLFRINKRPADVERDTKGKVKADTVRGWLSRKHFPEKHNFIQFCYTYGINAEAAKELIYGPAQKRDVDQLERRTSTPRALTTLNVALDAIVGKVDLLEIDQQRQVIASLESALRRVRAVSHEASASQQ